MAVAVPHEHEPLRLVALGTERFLFGFINAQRRYYDSRDGRGEDGRPLALHGAAVMQAAAARARFCRTFRSSLRALDTLGTFG